MDTEPVFLGYKISFKPFDLAEDRHSHLSRLLIEREQSVFSLRYFEKMQCFCVFCMAVIYLNLDVVSQVMLATYFIDFIIPPNIHLTCPLVYLCLKSTTALTFCLNV